MDAADPGAEASEATVRLTTWNLQGRARPDLGSVARELGRLAADVVVLQEVQRRQARSLARALGWSHVWRLKHWPVVVPAEGLAVLSRLPVVHDEVTALARRWMLWSSDRRIAVVVDVRSAGTVMRVVDVHLGAGVGDPERVRQAAVVTGLATTVTPSVVAGDMNTAPGSAVVRELGRPGHRDAWETLHGERPGPTNWRAGRRDGAPTQRLDYVMVDRALDIVDVAVPAHGTPGFGRYGPLSDHLPVTVTLAVRPGRSR